MKTIKSRFLLALTAVAMIVCLCFGIVACKKDKGKEKETFPAPSNVVIVGDSLKWDAVDEAAEYTVKINSDETTSTANTTLDLTTVKGKLVSGENKLSVKVNETDERYASEYSAEVTYNYTPQSTPTDQKLATPVVTREGDTLKWEAVANATGYTVKIGEGTLTVTATTLDLTSDEVTALLVRGENTITVKANAGTGAKDSDYSVAVKYEYTISSDEEAASFKTSVSAIGEVTLGSAEKIAVAKTKYNALSDEAKAVEGVDAAIATLIEKDNAYFALLVGEAATVSTSSTVAELNGAKTAIDNALAYYEKLIDKTGAATAKATLDGKKTAYDTAVSEIEATVDTLADEIDELLAKDYSATEPTIADYNALTAKKNAVDALEEYAAQYWADSYSDKVSAIANKQAEIAAIPVSANTVKGQSTVVCNHQTQNPNNQSFLYVMRSYKNVLGEALTGTANLPTVTVSDNATVTNPTAANADGVFVWKITFTTPAENDVVTLSYTVGDEQTVDITAEVRRTANIYSGRIDNGLFKFDGGMEIEKDAEDGSGNKVNVSISYFDVYMASDILISNKPAYEIDPITHGEVDIEIKGMPLAQKISVKSDISLDSLKSLIARQGIRSEVDEDENVLDLKLAIVLYNMPEAEEGEDKVIYSNVNSKSVFNLTCKLTEEDTKEKLAFGNSGAVVWNDETPDPGAIILGGYLNDDIINSLKTQLDLGVGASAADVYNELRYIVTVTLDGESKEFSVDCTDGSIASAVLKRNIYKLFKDEEATGYTLVVRLALRANSDYSDRLRDSENMLAPLAWSYTVSKADAQFPIQGLGQNLNTNVTISTTESKNGTIAYGSWEYASDRGDAGTHSVYMHDYHDGLALLIFEANATGDETRDFVAEGVTPFAVYTHRDASDMNWATINAEIDKVWAKLPAEQRTDQKHFVFAVQVIVNEEGEKVAFINSEPIYFLDSADNTKHAVVEYNRNFTVPTGNQVWFSTNGYLIFARTNGQMPNYVPAAGTRTDNESNNGDIFSNGVTCIEIKFEKDGVSKSAYLFKEEDGRLHIYTDKEQTTDGRDCNPATDGGIEISAFNTWVIDNYGLTGFDAADGWAFSSMVHHDGSYYVGENNYSNTVTYTDVNPA